MYSGIDRGNNPSPKECQKQLYTHTFQEIRCKREEIMTGTSRCCVESFSIVCSDDVAGNKSRGEPRRGLSIVKLEIK